MDHLIYKIKRLEQVLSYKKERTREELNDFELQYNEIKEKIRTVQQEINDIQAFKKEYQNCINKISIKVKNIIIWVSLGILMFFTEIPFVYAISTVSVLTAIMCNCKKIIEYRGNIKHTNMKQLVRLLEEKEEERDSLKSEAKTINDDIFILHQTINEIRSDIRSCKMKTSEQLKPLIDFDKDVTKGLTKQKINDNINI